MLFDSLLLKSFVAVCDTRSFTKAARTVNLTQPAISLHIKRLEEQAATRLIDRAAHRLALTADGEVLLSYARRILALHEEAKIELGRLQPCGLVRLGAPEYFHPSILASLLAQFASLYPDVRLEIQIGLGPGIAMLFDQGQLDVAIVNRELGESEGSVLFRQRRVWAASKTIKLDSAAPVPLALFPPNCAWRRLALSRLDEAGRTWKLVLQSTGVTGILAAVEAGLAVSVCAESSLTSAIRQLGSAGDLPPLPDFEYVMRRANNISVAANRLADVIIDFFRLSAALGQPLSGAMPGSCGEHTRRLTG
ncbi:MAG: LysR family transcriptional regulator [Methylocella sp.]